MQDELKKLYEEERLKRIRNRLGEAINDFVHLTGRVPAAIVADIDAFYELRSDRECAECGHDGIVRYGGIPLLRSYFPRNSIYLCPELIPVIEIPPRKN